MAIRKKTKEEEEWCSGLYFLGDGRILCVTASLKKHSQTNDDSEQHPPSLMTDTRAGTKAESSFPGASLVTRGGTLVRVY